MIDVVANNMAYAGAGADTDYSSFTPFNNKEYFHNLCLVNYSSTTNVQQVCLCLRKHIPITHKDTVLVIYRSGIIA